MKIPYNEDLRPDTGLYNAKLGIWLFLASEVMLFGALFSAYIMLRMSDPNWLAYTEKGWYVLKDLLHYGPEKYADKLLNVPLATLNTVVLISSSVTMVMSWVALKMNNFSKYKLYMGLTLLCSFGFLIIKYMEYTEKLSHGIVPSTNNFTAVYYTMTGLHGIHVIGGILLNYYLWKTFSDIAIEKYSKWFVSIALILLLMSVDFANTGQTQFLMISTLLYGLAVYFSRAKDYVLYAVIASFGLIASYYNIAAFEMSGSYILFMISTVVIWVDALMNNFKPKATYEDQKEQFTNRIEIAGLYWHFVDLVWIFLFPALYLL